MIQHEHHNEVIKKFHSLAQFEGEKYRDFGDHLTDLEVCDLFMRNSIQYSCHTYPSVIDVTSFIEKTNYDCISFVIKTMFENLSSEIQEELYACVKNKSTCTTENRWFMPRPTSMILVQK